MKWYIAVHMGRTSYSVYLPGDFHVCRYDYTMYWGLSVNRHFLILTKSTMTDGSWKWRAQ